MRVFNYSFLNNGLLPANLVNLTSSIVSLKTIAGVRKDEYVQIFTELESIAKVQSVKSSNAIEGIVTSDERIQAIVNQNSAPLNHNEAEIAGYRDALNTIHLSYEHIDFRQSDILRLHEMMMSIAGYEYGGQYKTDDNVILEVDAAGQQRVRFRPTPAEETPQAMEQLELAYMAARSDSSINQLLLTRKERMALGANFNADVLLCGTRVNHIAACAGNGRFLIVRMYILHICHLFRLICG